MKRFIRYLYEYENEKRIRNVGFIKVETGCDKTVVHMQAKGFHNSEEQRLVLYLFYEENEEIVGIIQGEVTLSTPALSWYFEFGASDVGGEETYSKICGVLVETGSGRRIAATWDDRCVNVNRMREPLEAEDECVVEQVVDEEVTKMEQEEIEIREEQEEREDWIDQEEQEDWVVQEDREEQIVQKRYTKISRQDIATLPRCEWKLANNQFLMHGYNNFHYLLLIDDGKHLKLGVPGIYHIKEAKCAEAFGFEEFLSADELGISGESEQENEELFGYWCRPVRRRRI